MLLIAGGVGITPLRALLESLPAAPGDLTLIYRVSSLRDAVFRRELEEIAARREAKVWFVAGTRAELGDNPLSGGELTRRVPGLIDHDVYLCGPPGLTAAVTRELPTPGYGDGRSTTSRSSSDQERHLMRRVILAICATAVGLVLLLSFKTHTQSAVPGTSPAAALGSPTPGRGATAVALPCRPRAARSRRRAPR